MEFEVEFDLEFGPSSEPSPPDSRVEFGSMEMARSKYVFKTLIGPIPRMHVTSKLTGNVLYPSAKAESVELQVDCALLLIGKDIMLA